MTRRPTAPAARRILGALAACALVLVSGCSYFSHATTWTKDGATEEQSRSDLAQCQEEADVQTARDRNIDQDIAASDSVGNSGIDTAPIQSMQSYKSDRRYRSILSDCMAQLGYRAVE